MCEVGLALGAKSLDEVGELTPAELHQWSEVIEEKRELEDLKWDARVFAVGEMIRHAIFGKVFDPAPFLLQLFKPKASTPAPREMAIRDPAEMRDVLKAWCLAAGGKVIERQ